MTGNAFRADGPRGIRVVLEAVRIENLGTDPALARAA